MLTAETCTLQHVSTSLHLVSFTKGNNDVRIIEYHRDKTIDDKACQYMSMQITQNEHQVKRCEHVETECEVSLSKAESAVRIGSRGWESLRVSAGNQLILISSPQQTVSRLSAGSAKSHRATTATQCTYFVSSAWTHFCL